MVKIIDACCGVGPSRAKDKLVPYTPEQLLAIMDQCGIACALAYDRMSAAQGDPVTGNAVVCELAARNPRFLPAFTFGLATHDTDPTARDYLTTMQATNCRAAWLWPIGGVRTAHWLYGEIFALCEETRLPLFVSATVCTPDDVFQIGSTFPRLRLVLTGMGYMADAWLYPLLRRLPALHICYGHYYITPNGIERFVRHFSARRLLFGSGLPEYAPGGLIGYLQYADVSQEDKALILAGNLEALMAEVRL